MEDGNIPVLAKKVRQMVKVILLMVRKGISKWPKLMLDLNMMMKGRKIAGKAILHNLMFHHHPHSATRSHDGGRLSFYGGPQEYEFSCSSSPAKRPRHHNSQLYFFPCAQAPPTHDDLVLPADANAVRRELEMLARKGGASPAISAFLQSPAVSELIYSELSSPALPGFGRTPLVRQLRVTDSPFPLRDVDKGDHRVDEKAADFIMKFYNELRKQNTRAPH
ncbi:uncharacterized protein LOC127795238 [Diospyros lotus]|uniref:uncharacterized protein LOC127795238 n=1 Tax=Diospyros lotus TaxID=55363 RepID=UPI00225742C4|nr:uncharacterized protein LOC127795238 [Diospyros lotus]